MKNFEKSRSSNIKSEELTGAFTKPEATAEASINNGAAREFARFDDKNELSPEMKKHLSVAIDFMRRKRFEFRGINDRINNQGLNVDDRLKNLGILEDGNLDRFGQLAYITDLGYSISEKYKEYGLEPATVFKWLGRFDDLAYSSQANNNDLSIFVSERMNIFEYGKVLEFMLDYFFTKDMPRSEVPVFLNNVISVISNSSFFNLPDESQYLKFGTGESRALSEKKALLQTIAEKALLLTETSLSQSQEESKQYSHRENIETSSLALIDDIMNHVSDITIDFDQNRLNDVINLARKNYDKYPEDVRNFLGQIIERLERISKIKEINGLFFLNQNRIFITMESILPSVMYRLYSEYLRIVPFDDFVQNIELIQERIIKGDFGDSPYESKVKIIDDSLSSLKLIARQTQELSLGVYEDLRKFLKEYTKKTKLTSLDENNILQARERIDSLISEIESSRDFDSLQKVIASSDLLKPSLDKKALVEELREDEYKYRQKMASLPEDVRRYFIEHRPEGPAEFDYEKYPRYSRKIFDLENLRTSINNINASLLGHLSYDSSTINNILHEVWHDAYNDSDLLIKSLEDRFNIKQMSDDDWQKHLITTIIKKIAELLKTHT